MNLHFFFEGKMGREEAASAFLATVLEQRASLRQAFLSLVQDSIDRPDIDLKESGDWNVSIEGPCDARSVDIMLEEKNGSTLLLVENKIRAGSKQKGQLLQYYTHHVKQNPEMFRTIGAIYLAPGTGIGGTEVKNVQEFSSILRRKKDFAARVSWEKLIERFNEHVPVDPCIHAGLEQIKALIEKDPVVYSVEGDREVVLNLVKSVSKALRNKFPSIGLGKPWPKPDHYTLSTKGTNVTLWLVALFCAEKEKPFRPVDVWDGERLTLTVEARLNLSAKGRKLPEVRHRWEEAMRNQSLDLPDFGGGKAVENRGKWVVKEYPVIGTIAEATARMTQIGAAALQKVMSFG